MVSMPVPNYQPQQPPAGTNYSGFNNYNSAPNYNSRPPQGYQQQQSVPVNSYRPPMAAGYPQVAAQQVSQPVAQPARLRSPFGQGCFFGLIQGLLSALIVIGWPGAIQLAVGLGFFFYALAGLRTTQRGGGFLRGLWSGFWGGIHSTWIFWVTFIGIWVFQFAQSKGNSGEAYATAFEDKAWQEITGRIMVWHFQGSNSPVVNMLLTLLISLAVACVCGLVGGILGTIFRRQNA
jgi:hypothetical protein